MSLEHLFDRFQSLFKPELIVNAPKVLLNNYWLLNQPYLQGNHIYHIKLFPHFMLDCNHDSPFIKLPDCYDCHLNHFVLCDEVCTSTLFIIKYYLAIHLLPASFLTLFIVTNLQYEDGTAY